MIPLSLADVASAVDGRLVDVPDATVAVTGPVVVDSREAGPGALFVALPGERADGHDFAAQAVAAGAVGVLAAHPIDALMDAPGSAPGGVPAVVVADPLVALGRLARAVLDRLPQVTVVAVTGSSGKTSTKDLLAQVLAHAGPTVAPPGSWNNEVGLPLTVLRADEGTRHLAVEMGARGAGHLRYLCAVAPPQVSVVLNVGTAHVGEFGSRAAIAAAKGELVEVLPTAAAGGVAVLNADDELVRAMAVRTRARVVTFGVSPDAGFRAEDVRLDAQGRPSFTLVTPDGSAPVALRLYGEHHVSNALATAAVAGELGMHVGDIARALGAAAAVSRWRMEVTERPDGVTIVNDAYNANPESVKAALKALVAMAGGAGGRRSWAVLGEMRELGDTSAQEHDAVGRLAVRLDVARLVAVGTGARPVHLGATLEGSWGAESVWVPDAQAAVDLLRRELRAGDVVLVKASRAAGLEQVAAALLDSGAAPDSAGAGTAAGGPAVLGAGADAGTVP